jgi:putative transposase
MAKNMLVTEFKLYGMQDQFKRIDECIRTTQFIRNKCIRLWINEGAKPKDKRAKIGKYEFSAQAAVLAEQYGFMIIVKRRPKAKRVILNSNIMLEVLN